MYVEAEGTLSLKTGTLDRLTIDPSGNVGIGTTTPATKLDVSGAVKIGNDATACAAGLAGSLRYNSSVVEYCNGSSWQAFGVSGAGLTSLNGQTASTQTFANGTTGLAPAFSSASNIHTLNVPLASGAGVTSGTISKTDYDNFTAKLTSPLTTKGDIIVRDASAAARLAVGTNGQVLKANSATATGLQWAGISAATDLSGVLPVANGGTNSSTALTNGKVMISSAGAIIEGVASDTAKTASTFVMRDGSGNIAAALGTFDQLSVLTGGTLGLNGSVAGTVGIRAPASVTSWNMTLPTSAGTTGQVLSTNGSGVTSWVTPAANGGTFLAADGTAAAPGFAFNSSGNQDNGLFLPAANQIALSTAGTERMRINASGNVGIGTTSPGRTLEVRGAAYDTAIFGRGGDTLVNVSTCPELSACGTSGSKAALGLDGFQNSWLVMAESGNTSGLSFVTSYNINATATEKKVFFRNDGNVGIGTTSPATKLDVAGGVRIGTEAAACAVGLAGTIRYNGGVVEFCNGSTWGAIGGGATISGSGTTNAIPKFTAAGAIGNSAIIDDGTTITATRAITSVTNPIATGASMDLGTSNTHTLASVGGSAITVSNMKDGGVYNVVIEDTTSRTYTFTGCTNSYFRPVNGPTTAGTRTVYGLMTVRKGANWDCYITWSTGFL